MTDSHRRRTLLQASAAAAFLAGLPSAQAQQRASVPSAAPSAWPAWATFKAQFISEGGRVISEDGKGGQTYSEGQA